MVDLTNLPPFDKGQCDACRETIDGEAVVIEFPTLEQGRSKYAFCHPCADKYLEKVPDA